MTRSLTAPPAKGDSAAPAVLSLRVAEILSALSLALDLTEGQPMGHSVNTCLLGMRLARIIGLSDADRANLYYAMLLKDAGCSNNAARMYEIFGGDDLQAKREVKTQDWTRVSFEGLNYLARNVMPGRSSLDRLLSLAHIILNRDTQTNELITLRCQRGAEIARGLGFSSETCEAILALDEHWNGSGYPHRLNGQAIPIGARIASICQTIEVFAALNGPEDAFRITRERSGTWFDPELVTAAETMANDAQLWKDISAGNARKLVLEEEPPEAILFADEPRIDTICEAFANIIDVKSPYTARHSTNVTRWALLIAKALDLPATDIVILRRAAMLHDVGKLSVPNTILDKPGPLTAGEWETVRLHPYYTQRILEKINGFQHLAFVASTHHEKLDGSGYFRNLRAVQLPISSRALTVADIFDALSAERPYRSAMPLERVFQIMDSETPHAIDADCLRVLKESV